MNITIMGVDTYPDKHKGVTSLILKLYDAMVRANPNDRLHLQYTADATGDLLLAFRSSPGWETVRSAVAPREDAVTVGPVDDPGDADIIFLFWDPRRRRPDLLKLAHDLQAKGKPVKCYAYTGMRTIGPIDLPAIRTQWTGT